MQQKKSNRKPLIIGTAVLLVLVIAALAVWLITRDKPVEGLKNITVEVVLLEGDPKEHRIATEQEYLSGALLDEGLIAGTEGEWGLMIETVDGVTVDAAKQQWWMLTKDGEMTATGASEIAIADGDRYELTLVEGYD